VSTNIISDDILAGLKSQAKATGGGSWVRLTEKDEWVSGVVLSRSIEEAPFGEVETLHLKGVRTHERDYDPDEEIEFRLASIVLTRNSVTRPRTAAQSPG
jgi:hypothetical protein